MKLMSSHEKPPPPPINNKMYLVFITSIIVLGAIAALIIITNDAEPQVFPFEATADVGEMQINQFDLDDIIITYPYEITAANYPLHNTVILAVPGDPDQILTTHNGTVNKNAKHEGIIQATCKTAYNSGGQGLYCAISSDEKAMKLLKAGDTDFPVFSPLEPRFSIYVTAEDSSGNDVDFHVHKRYGLN